jgi:putative tricarboxylic transport membrane protein
MWDSFLIGLNTVAHPFSLAAIAFGVLWGVIGGMIPGINATIAMALMLPFTWGMEPSTAVMMLAGVYCGGEYGGSIPAVLIGTPGTTAAACTVVDGYELHKQGRTGDGLFTSLISSVFGGVLGAIALMLIAVPLAAVALSFGPSEYFAIAVMGLTLICSLGGKNVFKGILAGIFGIFVACIGFDPFSGVPRFTFGSLALSEGFEMIPVMMGLFAMSEILTQAEELTGKESFVLKGVADTSFPSWQKIKSFLPVSFFSSILGVVIGALPGVGATTAAFVAYSETKRWSKDSDTFGKGNIKGVAAPEAANNAVTGGAMVPLLALGLPGSNSTAIMLGALMIHNVNPGPILFEKHPEIPYGIFGALLVSNVFLFFVGYLCIKMAMKVTNISKPVLVACITALVFTGAYAYSMDVFDILVTLGFGILGYIMKKYGLPHTSTVLGFVLGFIMEVNFRRALIVTQGDYFNALFNSQLSTIILVIAFVSVAFSIWQNIKKPVEVEDSTSCKA